MYGLTPFARRTYDLFDAFHDFENDFFGDKESSVMKSCKTDIIEQNDKYVVEAELPGFKKEDIKLDINNKYLTITAEHSDKKDKEDKDNKYIYRERSYSSFKRTFNIVNINTDDITAEYKDGILVLELPKKAETAPVSKSIEIK